MHKTNSLFRVSKHKRFNYDPLYYDPIVEELEQRESKIRKEMQAENGSDSNNYRPGYTANIRGSFRQGSNRSKDSTSLIRIIILIVLIVAALFVLGVW